MELWQLSSEIREGNEYAILAPVDSDEDEDAYVFKIVYENEEQPLL